VEVKNQVPLGLIVIGIAQLIKGRSR